MSKTIFSRRAAALCAAFACWSAQASDSPADYSHAVGLNISGKNAVLKVRLPQGVYLHARSAELNDLRVFDANGKAQPYALVRPEAPPQAARRRMPVKLFPVGMAPGAARDPRNDIEVRTSADGASVSVSTRHTPGARPEPATMMLDLGGRQRVDALVFTLPPGAGNYQGQVQLEVSDDLQQWETIGYASLNWLANSSSDTLSSDRMELDPRVFRYGRLRWRQGEPIQFAGIVAESEAPTESSPPMDSVTLRPRPGKQAGELIYDSAIAIPVQRMNLVFSEDNVVMPALVGQYMSVPGRKGAVRRELFVPHLQATFFKISQDGKTRSAGELDLGEVHAQAWVLRPREPSAAQPRMTLAWTPASLVFMAGGTAPYALRFGQAGAAPGQRPLSQVAPGFTDTELRGLEQAGTGALQVNPAAQDRAGGQGGGWRLAALWSVLLAGVGVLGYMAWRLLGQMKEEG